MDDISENPKSGASLNSSLVKAIHILKGLAASAEDGVRLIDLARDLELSQPSTHRLLKTLIAETSSSSFRTRRPIACRWNSSQSQRRHGCATVF